jgi:hypothetical protein
MNEEQAARQRRISNRGEPANRARLGHHDFVTKYLYEKDLG